LRGEEAQCAIHPLLQNPFPLSSQERGKTQISASRQYPGNHPHPPPGADLRPSLERRRGAVCHPSIIAKSFSPLLSGCLDRREGLQVFGDIVYTIESILVKEANFFIVIMEERNLARDNFIVAY
jgi:hypothetical protein